VCPGFALDPENAPAIMRICQTLDGIPLAIELAAARARALSVGQIASRLDDRFQLLASGDRTAAPRHQTLRATVDWSYELLTGPEQVLLRRLAVFAGWDLEMAERVCSDEQIPAGSVLDLLVSLIDKSLVGLDREVAGDARYRLLDTIKEYAARQLAASGEEQALRLRHRDYIVGLVHSIESQGFQRGDPPWQLRLIRYRRLILERDNCLAALAVTLERGDAEAGLRLCIGLRSPWITHGDLTEGAGWFDRFIGISGPVSPRVRGCGFVYRAELAFELQDYRAAQDCALAGLELGRSSGDGTTTAAALRVLGQVAMRAGHSGEAVARLDEAVGAAQAAGSHWEEGLTLSVKATITARQGRLREAQDCYEAALDAMRDNNRWGLANILYGIGSLARIRGDHAAALRHFEDALAIFRELDGRPDAARCLAGIGWVALQRGDLVLARSRLGESLRLSLATGQRLAIARGLEALAAAVAAADDPERAVRLTGAAFELREAAGKAHTAGSAGRLESLLGLVRERLGDEALSALLAEGREMTADEAVGYAIGQHRAARGDTLSPGQAPGAEPRDQAADGDADASLPEPGDTPVSQQPQAPTQRPQALAQQSQALALTRRELEIAALIARGLSNRAIADELVISPATAARHVANILAKLGFSSRTQVAVWVARHKTVPQEGNE
jgi:DNA-binding CsgD family transcriptional regulator/Tfp pilus assembly protein PilF